MDHEARNGSLDEALGWWILGLGRPSPFFDDRTNAPRALPYEIACSDRTAV